MEKSGSESSGDLHEGHMANKHWNKGWNMGFLYLIQGIQIANKLKDLKKQR